MLSSQSYSNLSIPSRPNISSILKFHALVKTPASFITLAAQLIKVGWPLHLKSFKLSNKM
jgi:hypothetical protein